MSDQVQLVLEELAFRGDALARADGHLYFVAGGIPGEEVIADVILRRRRRSEARTVQVLKPSPHRVEAPCPYFLTCGGCQLQHINYAAQLEYKRQIVVDHLVRRGGFEDPPVRPVIGMEEPWHYRNQARFSVGPDGQLGFTERFTKRFLRIETCLIVHPKINAVLQTLQDRCYAVKHQLVVRYGFNTGDLLVFPKVELDDLPFETGQPYYEEMLLGKRFRIYNASFFQTNTIQAETLARIVRDRLALTGRETVVDAYCGVGTFGLLLADQAHRIIGIEESASAIQDARHNCRGYDNIQLIEAKTEHVLPTLEEPVDAVILDPPRVGCQPEVMQALIKLRPPRVIYVSCDPYTLARDLRILVDGGYELVEVQPIDMFPHTYHVESVTTLRAG
jgi:23S rRNA (uracil1939-C5)-methyltransferase